MKVLDKNEDVEVGNSTGPSSNHSRPTNHSWRNYMTTFEPIPSLTCEFSIHHDVQVFLGMGADISGDGVEPNGRILQ